MPNFYLQRLANRFPGWTKIRRDPSSMGQRLMSVFADYFEYNSSLNFRMQDDLNLLKMHMGVEALHGVTLAEADHMAITRTTSGAPIVAYPTTVQGTAGSAHTLTRYTNLPELFSDAPDRLTSKGTMTFSSYSVWTSASPFAYSSIPEPERLTVSITGSTKYNKKSTIRDVAYNGQTGVFIKGTDQNDIEFVEHVKVRDDGSYTTRNIFKSVTEVSYEGFDGAVQITWSDASQLYFVDPYHIAVMPSFEGRLKVEVSNQTISATNYAVAAYKVLRLDNGDKYLTGAVTDYENEELVSEQVLLDSAGSPYTAVDISLNHRNGYLVVLDSDGKIHTYNHGPTLFTASDTVSTSTGSDMELESLGSYVKLGDTENLFTFFRRVRKTVKSVVIKRTTPGATVAYLQSDKTWGVSPYEHVNAFDNTTPAKAWRNLKASTTYNELGVWKYEVTTVFDSGTQVYHTSVMVDSIRSLTSIATGVSSPNSMYFDRKGQLCVQASTVITRFAENVDGYIADANNQRLLLKEEYTSITVTP